MRIRAQLRLDPGNRRTADYWNRNSVERGAHRRKAPVPVRVCFAGADARWGYVPPASLRSSEDRVGIRAQFRPTFARRRKTNTEEPNSVERDAHRRKAPVPVRVCFAGAGSRANIVPPGSRCSTKDRVRIRAQLRLEPGNRRSAGHWHRSSDEGAFVGGWRHRRAGIVSLCKIFLTSLSHFPLQIIPTGVLLSTDNRNLKTL